MLADQIAALKGSIAIKSRSPQYPPWFQQRLLEAGRAVSGPFRCFSDIELVCAGFDAQNSYAGKDKRISHFVFYKYDLQAICMTLQLLLDWLFNDVPPRIWNCDCVFCANLEI